MVFIISELFHKSSDGIIFLYQQRFDKNSIFACCEPSEAVVV